MMEDIYNYGKMSR